MYTYNDRVKMSETDKRRNWTIPAIIDAMQNCVMFQLEDLGVGLDHFDEKNKLLVVTCWQVKIFSLPKLFDKITVGTQAYGFKSATGLRHCMIWDDKGALAIASNSVGVFIHAETGRPVKTPPEEWQQYDINPDTPCNSVSFQDKHICLPETTKVVEEFDVNIHHLDINNHMNNGQYVRIAYNYLPDDFRVAQFRVEYKKQATLGDRVFVKLSTDTKYQSSVICVSICDIEGSPYAIVEFSNK
ncbi:acyl-[acyl-carrier-protein] thioesterase [Aminipila sp.]|uniref:acyl-[acyl-carrier-protein] thioesterase n=1 Tax=Aminipila sp. TaxID=2060095 RepID=UPI00289697A3|nr:acyl-ACP thioesterase domain-containing protein [Aminipila sp.]